MGLIYIICKEFYKKKRKVIKLKELINKQNEKIWEEFLKWVKN